MKKGPNKGAVTGGKNFRLLPTSAVADPPPPFFAVPHFVTHGMLSLYAIMLRSHAMSCCNAE